MNKELIKRLRDEPDSQQKKHGLGWQEMLVWHKTCIEAADALEVADKRIEHLEADNAVHDSEAKLANERIEQLEIRLAALADVAGIFMDFGSNGSEVAAQIKEALAAEKNIIRYERCGIEDDE